MAPNTNSISTHNRLLKEVGQRKEKRNRRQKQKSRPSQRSASPSSKLIPRSKKEQNSTSNTEEISQPQLATSEIDSSLNTYTSPYSMSPYSMNMSPLSMMQYGPSMGYGMNSMGFGPLSTINQYLFSFQSFIFAIGQAVQIVGMNTHQLHQLYDQLTTMADQALFYIYEMRTLQEVATKNLSDEERKRRRRLKAIRWGLLFGASYASFWTILKWYKKRKDLKRRKRHMITEGGEMFSYGTPNMHSKLPTLQSSPQYSIGSMNMTSTPSMYPAQSNYGGYGYSQPPHQQYYY